MSLKGVASLTSINAASSCSVLESSDCVRAESGQSKTNMRRSHRITSATFGAILVAILVTPFDVIKTRMQADISANSRPNSILFDHQLQSLHSNAKLAKWVSFSTSKGAEPAPIAPFKGTFDALRRIWLREGAAALWKGLLPTLVMQAPSTVLYYIGYEDIRDFLELKIAHPSGAIYAPLIAGALARAGTTIVISPLELVRTRMQSGPSSLSETSFRGVLNQVRGMVRTSSIFSLWRGLGPTLWRDVPFSAIYWVGYESLRKRISRNSVGDFGSSFISGAVAGTFAAVLTTPFDVAKTLQQVVHHDEPGCGSRRLSMIGVLRGIWKQDGLKGLFVGITPRVAKVAPACAIMISSYEVGKRFFANKK